MLIQIDRFVVHGTKGEIKRFTGFVVTECCWWNICLDCEIMFNK